MPGFLNRLALVLLSLTAVASQARGEVTSDDWSRLHMALRGESWSDAVAMSLDLLNRLPETAGIERAQLRHSYLFALSGVVVSGEMSHEELAAQIAPMIGLEIALPAHLVADPSTNGPMFNQIAKTDDESVVMVIAANQDVSSVHCFTYASLAQPVDVAAHAGEIGFVRGRLNRVEPSAIASQTYPARVFLDDASIAFQSR